MTRILITGSRNWTDRDVIHDALFEYTAGLEHETTVVHGGAPGADYIAGIIAAGRGMTVEVHPANWESCGPTCNPSHLRYRAGSQSYYCPRSGFVRNDKMVKLGADICLAFIKNDSRGTRMCADLAEKAGITVHRYRQTDHD